MSLRTIFNALRDLLNENGFERQAFEYGYDALTSGTDPFYIILRLAGNTLVEEITTYGTGYQHHWPIQIEAYQLIGQRGAGEVHADLVDHVDEIIALLEKWPHLGTGRSTEIVVTVTGIGEIAPALLEDAATVTHLMCPISIIVDDFIQVAEAE